MKKLLAMSLAVAMLLSFAACGTPSSDSGTKAAATEGNSATTEVPAVKDVHMEAVFGMSNWAEKMPELVGMYIAKNPQIKSIDWTLVASKDIPDILKSRLAANNLPDFMTGYSGPQLERWEPYLLPLEDMEVLNVIDGAMLTPGQLKGHQFVLPTCVEGFGILYNMNYLKKVGYDHTPKTWTELVDLCEKLDAAGIRPFENHYKEAVTTLTSHYGLLAATVKDDPMAYVRKLQAGEITDMASDSDWNRVVDFYDLTMRYGNENAIVTDSETARGNFFLEKSAMVTDEGSTLLNRLRSYNPAMEDHCAQSYVPLFDDEKRNKITINPIFISITNTCKYPGEAKKFLTWFISDQEALDFTMKTWQNMPAVSNAKLDMDILGPLMRDTYNLIQAGAGSANLQRQFPDEIITDNGSLWQQYLTGMIDRQKLLTELNQLWINYAKGK